MIGFNIYDDYYDDGFVPKGEIQETWGRVEGYANQEGLYPVEAHSDEEGILHAVFAYLSLLYLPGIKVFVEGDQITFQHLTHARREQLLEWLQRSNLEYNGQKIDFYSES